MLVEMECSWDGEMIFGDTFQTLYILDWSKTRHGKIHLKTTTVLKSGLRLEDNHILPARQRFFQDCQSIGPDTFRLLLISWDRKRSPQDINKMDTYMIIRIIFAYTYLESRKYLFFLLFLEKAFLQDKRRLSLYEHFFMIFGESRKNKTSETPSCIDWEVWIAAWWIKSVVFGQFVATWPIVAILSLGGGDPPLCYQLKSLVPAMMHHCQNPLFGGKLFWLTVSYGSINRNGCVHIQEPWLWFPVEP